MKDKMVSFLFFMVFFVGAFTYASEEGKEQELQGVIECALQKADPTAHIGIEVFSLKNQDTIYRKNGQIRFVPASSIKVFTAAAALDFLGVDYRFETELVTDGHLKDGVIKGDRDHLSLRFSKTSIAAIPILVLNKSYSLRGQIPKGEIHLSKTRSITAN